MVSECRNTCNFARQAQLMCWVYGLLQLALNHICVVYMYIHVDIKWYISRWPRKLLPHLLAVSAFWTRLGSSLGPLEKQRYCSLYTQFTRGTGSTLICIWEVITVKCNTLHHNCDACALLCVCVDIPQVLPYWATGSTTGQIWRGSHHSSESGAWLVSQKKSNGDERGEERESCCQDPDGYDAAYFLHEISVSPHAFTNLCFTSFFCLTSYFFLHSCSFVSGQVSLPEDARLQKPRCHHHTKRSTSVYIVPVQSALVVSGLCMCLC